MLASLLRTLAITAIVMVIPCTLGYAAHPEELRRPVPKKQVTQAKSKPKKAPTTAKLKKSSPKKTQVVATKKKPKAKTTYYKLKGKPKYSKTNRIQESQLPNPRTILGSNFISEVTSPTDDRLEKAYLQKISSNEITIPRMPDFRSAYRGRVAGLSENKDFIQYSINLQLQEYAKLLVSKVSASHVAVVAMEPSTGRILAIADKSSTLRGAATHAGFPAASLIKVITSAAAVERSGMHPDTEIAFRGGTYELSRTNYNPRPNSDKRVMSVSEALGKSCNPVFSRVALMFLNPALLRMQTAAFGFNTDLKLQVPIPTSKAVIPNEDYEFGRTAAGFGDVYISPIHAASMMSAIANKGKLLQPTIVDQVISARGDTSYRFTPSVVRQAINPETAQTLMEMMTYTTTVGTSKREFAGKVPWEVAAKTGTLRGINPKGLNLWFIGAAPLKDPQIAVAVIVVNPTTASSKASHIARLMLEKYLS